MRALVARTCAWTLEIVKRSDVGRFVVLPKRWIVERTLAWISRNRRLSRDYERHTRIAVAFVKLAMIRIMVTAHLSVGSRGGRDWLALEGEADGVDGADRSSSGCLDDGADVCV